MTSPPTSEGVPKNDKPDPTIDHSPESPIRITTTPLHSSVSDLGSSTVMISSNLYDQGSKTPADLSEVESPGQTVILSFARNDVPIGEDTRRVVEDVVPAIDLAKRNSQNDDKHKTKVDGKRGTEGEDNVEIKSNQNAQGIGLGFPLPQDSTQDEDSIEIRTAQELLKLHIQKEQVVSEIKANSELQGIGAHDQDDHATEDPHGTILPPGSYIFGTMPGGLAGLTDDGRPYPPVPVLPSYSTTSSATATSGFGSAPSYPSLRPSASDGSSQGVQMIPPQADLPEVDQQQESDIPDFIRGFADRSEDVGRAFYDQDHARALQIQDAQRRSQHIRLNLLDGRPVLPPSGSASSDFYRPYADGTQAFDPIENQAHLQAQHQQRVANIPADKEQRAKALRSLMEAVATTSPSDKDSKGESDAARGPGMGKGSSKMPPKRKSAGARIMALRASKPTRKDAPGMSHFIVGKVGS